MTLVCFYIHTVHVVHNLGMLLNKKSLSLYQNYNEEVDILFKN